LQLLLPQLPGLGSPPLRPLPPLCRGTTMPFASGFGSAGLGIAVSGGLAMSLGGVRSWKGARGATQDPLDCGAGWEVRSSELWSVGSGVDGSRG
ncbi:hypothetical protein ACFL5O_03710, partial [Myxococcota bacterium]